MQANIATLKNSLSRYLRAVREGEEVVVFDRDRPVARLVPYLADGAVSGTSEQAGTRRDDEDADALLRRGAVTHRGSSAAVQAWIREHAPAATPGGTPTLSDLLQKMRDEERW
jgi:prevent-host-death family protein